MISYLVAFSFSGTKWNLLLTLSFFCWHECPRSLAQNSRKAPLWKRFSLARSMALSVGLLFLWKAVLLKDAYSLTGWITLWNTTTKKKKTKRDTVHIFLFIFKHKNASFFICWVFNDLPSHSYSLFPKLTGSSPLSQSLRQRLASRAVCVGISHHT